MLLAAILLLGILTMWVPARWPLAAFQVSIFALAAVRIAARLRNAASIPFHPVAVALGAAAGWGTLYLLRAFPLPVQAVASLGAFGLVYLSICRKP